MLVGRSCIHPADGRTGNTSSLCARRRIRELEARLVAHGVVLKTAIRRELCGRARPRRSCRAAAQSIDDRAACRTSNPDLLPALACADEMSDATCERWWTARGRHRRPSLGRATPDEAAASAARTAAARAARAGLAATVALTSSCAVSQPTLNQACASPASAERARHLEADQQVDVRAERVLRRREPLEVALDPLRLVERAGQLAEIAQPLQALARLVLLGRSRFLEALGGRFSCLCSRSRRDATKSRASSVRPIRAASGREASAPGHRAMRTGRPRRGPPRPGPAARAVGREVGSGEPDSASRACSAATTVLRSR
jgi:hypothetical protein